MGTLPSAVKTREMSEGKSLCAHTRYTPASYLSLLDLNVQLEETRFFSEFERGR